MGTFTPLVFGTNGGMGLDCQNFLRTLANKRLSKINEPYGSVTIQRTIQIKFELIKSNRDSVRKARKAYLIERGKTLEPIRS